MPRHKSQNASSGRAVGTNSHQMLMKFLPPPGSSKTATIIAHLAKQSGNAPEYMRHLESQAIPGDTISKNLQKAYRLLQAERSHPASQPRTFQTVVVNSPANISSQNPVSNPNPSNAPAHQTKRKSPGSGVDTSSSAQVKKARMEESFPAPQLYETSPDSSARLAPRQSTDQRETVSIAISSAALSSPSSTQIPNTTSTPLQPSESRIARILLPKRVREEEVERDVAPKRLCNNYNNVVLASNANTLDGGATDSGGPSSTPMLSTSNETADGNSFSSDCTKDTTHTPDNDDNEQQSPLLTQQSDVDNSSDGTMDIAIIIAPDCRPETQHKSQRVYDIWLKERKTISRKDVDNIDAARADNSSYLEVCSQVVSLKASNKKVSEDMQRLEEANKGRCASQWEECHDTAKKLWELKKFLKEYDRGPDGLLCDHTRSHCCEIAKRADQLTDLQTDFDVKLATAVALATDATNKEKTKAIAAQKEAAMAMEAALELEASLGSKEKQLNAFDSLLQTIQLSNYLQLNEAERQKSQLTQTLQAYKDQAAATATYFSGVPNLLAQCIEGQKAITELNSIKNKHALELQGYNQELRDLKEDAKAYQQIEERNADLNRKAIEVSEREAELRSSIKTLDFDRVVLKSQQNNVQRLEKELDHRSTGLDEEERNIKDGIQELEKRKSKVASSEAYISEREAALRIRENAVSKREIRILTARKDIDKKISNWRDEQKDAKKVDIQLPSMPCNVSVDFHADTDGDSGEDKLRSNSMSSVPVDSVFEPQPQISLPTRQASDRPVTECLYCDNDFCAGCSGYSRQSERIQNTEVKPEGAQAAAPAEASTILKFVDSVVNQAPVSNIPNIFDTVAIPPSSFDTPVRNPFDSAVMPTQPSHTPSIFETAVVPSPIAAVRNPFATAMMPTPSPRPRSVLDSGVPSAIDTPSTWRNPFLTTNVSNTANTKQGSTLLPVTSFIASSTRPVIPSSSDAAIMPVKHFSIRGLAQRQSQEAAEATAQIKDGIESALSTSGDNYLQIAPSDWSDDLQPGEGSKDDKVNNNKDSHSEWEDEHENGSEEWEDVSSTESDNNVMPSSETPAIQQTATALDVSVPELPVDRVVPAPAKSPVRKSMRIASISAANPLIPTQTVKVPVVHQTTNALDGGAILKLNAAPLDSAPVTSPVRQSARIAALAAASQAPATPAPARNPFDTAVMPNDDATTLSPSTPDAEIMAMMRNTRKPRGLQMKDKTRDEQKKRRRL